MVAWSMASSGTQWWRRRTHWSRPFRGKGAWFFVWFGYGDSLGNVGHDLGSTGVASITSNDEEVSSIKGRERGEATKKASITFGEDFGSVWLGCGCGKSCCGL